MPNIKVKYSEENGDFYNFNEVGVITPQHKITSNAALTRHCPNRRTPPSVSVVFISLVTYRDSPLAKWTLTINTIGRPYFMFVLLERIMFY